LLFFFSFFRKKARGERPDFFCQTFPFFKPQKVSTRDVWILFPEGFPRLKTFFFPHREIEAPFSVGAEEAFFSPSDGPQKASSFCLLLGGEFSLMFGRDPFFVAGADPSSTPYVRKSLFFWWVGF